jgi:dUTP pyrophosphatase
MANSSLRIAIARVPGNDDLPLPRYQTAASAAMDLHAAVGAALTIAPGAVALIPCGILIALPPGHEAQIRPRSGLAVRERITVINTPGTIDADYRGEIQVGLVNLGDRPFTVERGMRIAQLLVTPVPRIEWQEVAELPPTSRGAGGFGHTGA